MYWAVMWLLWSNLHWLEFAPHPPILVGVHGNYINNMLIFSSLPTCGWLYNGTPTVTLRCSCSYMNIAMIYIPITFLIFDQVTVCYYTIKYIIMMICTEIIQVQHRCYFENTKDIPYLSLNVNYALSRGSSLEETDYVRTLFCCSLISVVLL